MGTKFPGLKPREFWTTSQPLMYWYGVQLLTHVQHLSSSNGVGLWQRMQMDKFHHICHQVGGWVLVFASIQNFHNLFLAKRSSEGYLSGTLPFARISELFNINNIIVSQANPLVVPFLRHPVLSVCVGHLLQGLLRRKTHCIELVTFRATSSHGCCT